MAMEIGQREYPDRSTMTIKNVLPNIIKIDGDPKKAMFTAFMDRLPKANTSTEKFEWEILAPFERTVTVDGAVGSTQKTIKVDNPERMIPNMLFCVKRTGEILAVEDVDVSTKIVTCIREFSAQSGSGGTAAAAIQDGDTLIRISSYMAERNSRQITQVKTPTSEYNYCGIFRSDLSLTDREVKREKYTEDSLSLYQKQAMSTFLTDIDCALLFSERAKTVDKNNSLVTLTNGIRNVVQDDNVFDVGGTLYESQFDEFLAEVGMRYGSSRKVLFTSTKLFLAITQIAKTRMVYNTELSPKRNVSIGITIASYIDPKGGELLIVEDRNISEMYNGEGYGIDISQMKMREFTNNGRVGAISFHSNTSDRDSFDDVSTIYADLGLEFGAPETHFIIKNVDGGSSDLPSS